ncbi:MAG: hypothetical protein PW792_13875 [Acidobacteriaceae bacterium]|nr:hypothetical protein [Acidobacteriaceae bacterium]
MKLFGVLLAGLAVAVSGVAQQQAFGHRADGAQVPLMVYGQAMQGASCSPLVVLSHGAGGSERGYEYLAAGLAGKGWFVIVMGHRESGREAMVKDIRQARSLRDGVQELVSTPSAYEARIGDTGAALEWAGAQCKAKQAPFRALVGHSMGAETVLLEAGAKNSLGLRGAGMDRFDAYVAMSPQGAGNVFPKGAWNGLHKPVFDLTGTKDEAPQGGPTWRQEPYAGLPGAGSCDWLGVIDGATHMSFAGRGPDTDRINGEIVTAVSSFLEGARRHKCVLPPAIPGFLLRSK